MSLTSLLPLVVVVVVTAAVAGGIGDATHLVLVTTKGWDATTGRLTRFVRAGDGWKADGRAIDVVVGSGGLGWGIGLHGDGAPRGRSGPVKKEGDGKAPAGVFRIGDAFGYDAKAPEGTALRYTRLSDGWRCVDDPRSDRYNQVFDATGVTPSWKSAEKMRRKDALYARVVVVGHNEAARKGGGSCVFLHVWRSATAPTAGCTAMARADLEGLLGWMKPGKTVLVALPEAELDALRATWKLPADRRDR